MARTTKKKAKSAKTSPINGGAVVRTLVGEGVEAAWRIGTAVVVLGLIVAWIVGRGPLMDAAAQGRDLSPDIVFVATSGRDAQASNVPADVVASLEQIVMLHWSTDPFDRDALESVRAALAESGWFAEVSQVRRFADDRDGYSCRVEVSCVWRMPRAEVHPRRGAPVLVGNDSAPMRMPSDLPADGLVEILNPLEGAPREADGSIAYGRAWGLSDVSDALALMDLLAENELERSFVSSIDVRDPERMLITSTNGAQIVWGGPLDARRPGEASVQERVGLLSSMLRDPAFNRPGPVVDITTGRAVRDVRPGS